MASWICFWRAADECKWRLVLSSSHDFGIKTLKCCWQEWETNEPLPIGDGSDQPLTCPLKKTHATTYTQTDPAWKSLQDTALKLISACAIESQTWTLSNKRRAKRQPDSQIAWFLPKKIRSGAVLWTTPSIGNEWAHDSQDNQEIPSLLSFPFVVVNEVILEHWPHSPQWQKVELENWRLKEGRRGVREGSLQISAISQPDYLLTQWPLQLFSTRWRNMRLRKSVNREMDGTEGTPKEEGTLPSADQESG